MSTAVAIAAIALAAAVLMMLAELQLSLFNERVLRRRGAVEPPDDVYRTMQWVYPACFVAMAVEGALFGPPPGTSTVAGALLFGASKALKFWAITSLGIRWTFRVLVLPDAALVRRGPYAWMRHPNYVAVVGEMLSMAVLVGAPATGTVSLIAFGGLLHRRVRVEERALGIGKDA